MTEQKKSKAKFDKWLPCRCTEEMHQAVTEKVKRLGFDSTTSYMRTLIKHDLKFNYIKDLE